MATKTFKQQREELVRGKFQNSEEVATPQSAASDAALKNSRNSGENSTPGNNADTSSLEERIAKIEGIISSLKVSSNAGKEKFQMEEQDRAELRNFITTGVENKLKLCLPQLLQKNFPKAEEKKTDDCAEKYIEQEIGNIKAYYRESSENHSTVVALATAMDDRSRRDLKSREENNVWMRKTRTNQNTALNAAVRFGKQLRTDILSTIESALNRDKPSKPELHEGCTYSEILKFLFWQLPTYYVLCFLLDRHVKWFLRTMVISAFIVLLTLIGLMAHDLSECEVDAEKYHLLRDWVNIDSTKAADKCFYLDGLMEDRDNNAEEIQRLRDFLKNMRVQRSH